MAGCAAKSFMSPLKPWTGRERLARHARSACWPATSTAQLRPRRLRRTQPGTGRRSRTLSALVCFSFVGPRIDRFCPARCCDRLNCRSVRASPQPPSRLSRRPDTPVTSVQIGFERLDDGRGSDPCRRSEIEKETVGALATHIRPIRVSLFRLRRVGCRLKLLRLLKLVEHGRTVGQTAMLQALATVATLATATRCA